MNGLHVYRKNNGETVISEKPYELLHENNNIAMKRGKSTNGDTKWIEMIIPSSTGTMLGYIIYCKTEGQSRDSYWLPSKEYTSIEKLTGKVAPNSGTIKTDMGELLTKACDTAIDSEYRRLYEEALNLHNQLGDKARTIEDRAKRNTIHALHQENSGLQEKLKNAQEKNQFSRK